MKSLEEVITKAVELNKIDLGKVSVWEIAERMGDELSDRIREMRDLVIEEDHTECIRCEEKDHVDMMKYTSAGFICTECEEAQETNYRESVAERNQHERDVAV